MVKQTRIIVDIDDILSVRIVCRDCGAEMLFPPRQRRTIPRQCPHCPSEWADDLAPNPAWDGIVRLLRTVAYLAAIDDPPVTARLEIDGEELSPGRSNRHESV